MLDPVERHARLKRLAESQEQARARLRVFRESHVDQPWQREQNLVKQRVLLERLRYKQYVKRGTLARFLQGVGDFSRSHADWVIASLIGMYLGWVLRVSGVRLLSWFGR